MKKTINTTSPDTSASITTSTTASTTASTPPASPKLPHERDESVGMTGGVPSATVQQAYRDVKRGLQDTSRGTAANSAYEKLKKDTP